jgi:serine/threonine-protein kinase HipA
MTYSYNPSGVWTGQHQMSLNGKRDEFSLDDFRACARNASMKRGRAEEILQQVQNAVLKWTWFAGEAGVPDAITNSIAMVHRLDILH